MQVTFAKIYESHPGRGGFPTKTVVVPGQDCNLNELLARFQNGQRLNVHMREVNPMVYAEPYDDTPDNPISHPVIDNVDDLQLYQQELETQLLDERKKAQEEQKKPKEEPEKKETPPDAQQ